MDPDERKRRLDLFLEDIARHYDVWVEDGAERLAKGEDPAAVVREVLYGCLHSVLVTFAHGTALADHFNVYVVDEDGNEVTEGALHEEFVDHLFETGRYR
jgi:hypothetical protein